MKHLHSPKKCWPYLSLQKVFVFLGGGESLCHHSILVLLVSGMKYPHFITCEHCIQKLVTFLFIMVQELS